MSALLLVLSLAPRPAAAAPPLSADLDGDGKAEVARAEPGKIKVGAASFECGYDGFTCSVSLADVNPSDGPKELILCGEAPRADRACDLYAYEKGAIRQIPVLGQAWKTLDAVQIEAPGNGFVLVKNPGRLGEHLDKYSLDAGRTGLTLVRQPFRYVNLEVVTEKSLTLSLELDRKTSNSMPYRAREPRVGGPGAAPEPVLGGAVDSTRPAVLWLPHDPARRVRRRPDDEPSAREPSPERGGLPGPTRRRGRSAMTGGRRRGTGAPALAGHPRSGQKTPSRGRTPAERG